MDQDTKSLAFVIVLLTAFMGVMVIGQWMLVSDIYLPSPAILFKLQKMIEKEMLFRLLYVVLLSGSAVLFPIYKRLDLKNKWFHIFTTIFFATVLILGFSRTFHLYNLLFFPIVFVISTILIPRTIAYFAPRRVKSDDSIFGVSSEKSNFYFEFKTEKGILTIHKPVQNFWIDGGPGSGKSESFIKGMIYQCAERGYAGFIYDWEGDPTKQDSPILSRVAYGSTKHFKEKGERSVGFAFLNFVDMSRTVRVNVLSPAYMQKGSEALFIRNLAVTLMKNLEPSWKEKTDFWANNAINFVFSIAYKCYKERHLGIGTLSHVIAIALDNSDLVFEWLAEDPEIALNMSSMLTAWRLGAQQQTAGAVSSAQTPLVLLNSKYIFWVLSPLPEEEFSLDITNPEHPTLLCVGNSPSIKESTSPPISCIASIIMSQMNNPGKVKGSVFLVDEFPTVLLQGIDSFIGTARKHHVATVLALQDFNQAESNYGDKRSKTLRSACGNQAFGMTGNIQTAKDVESLFGEKKEAQESFSHQNSGGGSMTESLQKEKVVMTRDVAGQPAGHFIGKVANGKPPFFNLQFEMSKFIEEEIPAFSIPYKLSAGWEEKELEILDEMVTLNYNKIILDVQKILRKKRENEDNEDEAHTSTSKNTHKEWKSKSSKHAE